MQRIAATLDGIKKAGTPGIMAHMIAGFPDMETSYRIGTEMAKGGASILEIQIPFSDPVTDGPIIQHASSQALQHGYTLEIYCGLVMQLRTTITIPIVVMTYANIAWAYGIDRFVTLLRECGADGVIIPDLPMETDEGLRDSCNNNNIALIPVAAPGCSPERIQILSHYGSAFLYTAIRRGTTGTVSTFTEETGSWLSCVAQNSVLPCAVGFGIQHREQVVALAPFAQIAVAGSCIVRAVFDAVTCDHDPAIAAGEKVRALVS